MMVGFQTKKKTITKGSEKAGMGGGGGGGGGGAKNK